MVAMADSLHPDPDECLHCPQGDKPCPATYQPGAWLASQRLQAMTAPAVLARSKPAFRMPCAGCARPLQTIVGDQGRLPTDMESVWVILGLQPGA